MITTEKRFGHYVLTPASNIYSAELADHPEEYEAYQNEIARKFPSGRLPCAIPPRWTSFTLVAVRKYNHNASIFTFALQNPRRTLSLPPGAFLLVRAPGREHGGGDAIRPYTAVSDPAIRGSFDILVKRYDAWGQPPKAAHSAQDGASSSSEKRPQPAAAAAAAFSLASLGLMPVTSSGHAVNPYRPPGAVSTYIHQLRVGDSLDFKHSATCKSKVSLNLLLGKRTRAGFSSSGSGSSSGSIGTPWYPGLASAKETAGVTPAPALFPAPASASKHAGGVSASESELASTEMRGQGQGQRQHSFQGEQKWDTGDANYRRQSTEEHPASPSPSHSPSPSPSHSHAALASDRDLDQRKETELEMELDTASSDSAASAANNPGPLGAVYVYNPFPPARPSHNASRSFPSISPRVKRGGSGGNTNTHTHTPTLTPALSLSTPHDPTSELAALPLPAPTTPEPTRARPSSSCSIAGEEQEQEQDPDLLVRSLTIIAVGVGVAPVISILRCALYGDSDWGSELAGESESERTTTTTAAAIAAATATATAAVSEAGEATGASASPLVSRVRASTRGSSSSDKLASICLLLGVREVEDVLCRETLLQFERDFAGRFHVVFCVGSRYDNVHIGATSAGAPRELARARESTTATPAAATNPPLESVFDTIYSSKGRAQTHSAAAESNESSVQTSARAQVSHGESRSASGGYIPPGAPKNFDQLSESNREVGWVSSELIQKYQACKEACKSTTRVIVCGLPSVYDKLCGSRFVRDVPMDSVLGKLGYDASTVIKL